MSIVSGNVIKSGIPVYVYDDSDTKINKDKYGGKLVAIPIEEVIKGLQLVLDNDNYSRAKWTYDALVSMSTKRNDHHGMHATHCILYGY